MPPTTPPAMAPRPLPSPFGSIACTASTVPQLAQERGAEATRVGSLAEAERLAGSLTGVFLCATLAAFFSGTDAVSALGASALSATGDSLVLEKELGMIPVMTPIPTALNR